MVANVVRAMGCKRNHHRTFGFRVGVAGFAMAATLLVCAVQPAFADTPAVTDFGTVSEAVQDAWHQDRPTQSHYAMFLTLYQDGRRQVDVRPIHSDEVVSFRTEHPNWELSPELTWFINMPVYVKEVLNPTRGEAI